jgi:hypothetical protein
LLHELSHSFHHHLQRHQSTNALFASICAEIDHAYQHAVDSHLYDEVEYVRGGKQRHYALTNVDVCHDLLQFSMISALAGSLDHSLCVPSLTVEQEFFAECSEAYWGRNDYQPFDRDEFAQFDPVGYRAVERAWTEVKLDQP